LQKLWKGKIDKMAKITLNNTNSKRPYCETKEYGSDWNNKENISLNVGESINTKCYSCGDL